VITHFSTFLQQIRDVNTYSLFAELFATVVSAQGRASVIVPTGIAFDDTTRHFFNWLVDTSRLISLLSFFEVRRVVQGYGRSQAVLPSYGRIDSGQSGVRFRCA
jgi:hypothetical protein